MFIAMNRCGDKIGTETRALDDYGDEVLCAGWNPQLAQVGDRTIPRMDRHVDIFAELANVDVDDFLRKMYTYQG